MALNYVSMPVTRELIYLGGGENRRIISTTYSPPPPPPPAATRPSRIRSHHPLILGESRPQSRLPMACFTVGSQRIIVYMSTSPNKFIYLTYRNLPVFLVLLPSQCYFGIYWGQNHMPAPASKFQGRANCPVPAPCSPVPRDEIPVPIRRNMPDHQKQNKRGHQQIQLRDHTRNDRDIKKPE